MLRAALSPARVSIVIAFALLANAPAGSQTADRQPPRHEPPPRLRLQIQGALRTESRGVGNVQLGPTSPDGRLMLAIGSSPGLWDAASYQEIRRFEGLTGVQSGAFSPDGKQVLLGMSDRTARLLNLADGREVRRFETGSASIGVAFVAFSADGARVLTESGDGSRLWEVGTGRLVQTFRFFGGPAMSDDALAKMAKNYAQTPEGMRKILSGVTAFARAALFSADGTRVLLGLSDGTTRLADVSTGKEIRRFGPADAAHTPVSMSADGREVVTNDGRQHHRWDVATGNRIDSSPAPVPPRARAARAREDAAAAARAPAADIAPVMFSADGRWLVTAGARESRNQATFRVWDTSTGQPAGSSASVPYEDLLVSGSRVFTRGGGGKPSVWEIGSGHPVASTVASGDLSGLSRSGRRRISTLPDGSAQVIDVATGGALQTFSRPDDRIARAVLSPTKRLR